MEQYSDEWYAARAGKLTGSVAATVMGKPGKMLADLTTALAWERVYGPPPNDEHFESAAMKAGKEKEGRARDWYVVETDRCVEQVGFQRHPVLAFVGCSPDGVLFKQRRTVQIKAPYAKAWAEVRMSDEVPSEYLWQCRWEAWCFGWSEFEFCAWHPRSLGIIVEGTVTAEHEARMLAAAWEAEAIIREKVKRLQP